MTRFAFRLGLLLAACIVTASPATAQIIWNVTYGDGAIQSGGIGFASPTVVGSTTLGQLRRDCVTAATNYFGTVLDGRGTVNLQWNASFDNPGDGTLAFFGPRKFGTFNLGDGNVVGTFQNGGVYQSARTNTTVLSFGVTDGQGQVNFGQNYHYAVPGSNTTLSGNSDFISVMIHELGHGLGLLSRADPGTPTGVKGQFSEWDRSLQQGTAAGTGALFATDITQTNYGTFLGPGAAFTGGNFQNNQQTVFTNVANGLYFGGQYAREVLRGPVPIYSPTVYDSGSSGSHVNVGPGNIGVMNYQLLNGVQRKFQNYEIAILLDIGWNTYDWNSTSGNWSTGANAGEDVFDSRWETSQGLHFLDGSTGSVLYNARSPNGTTVYGKAPILPVYGQVTSNIILSFFGSGSASYTSTNDLGNVRLVRLNLASTSTATNTITGGTLQFGVNSDGTSSILVPKIVQQSSGVFNVNSNIITTNTTGAPGGGWTGLVVDGPGSGKVNLGGVISGTGTLTKAGTFTLELNGTASNTYTGTTTVSGGVLALNKTAGVNAIAGSVVLSTGGTLRLDAANQIADTAAVRLSGGTFSTGVTTGFGDTVGALELTASSTIDLGTGAHTLRFTGLTVTPTSVLTVTDWTGTAGGTGTGGKLLFTLTGDPNATYASFLSTAQFQGFGTGATFLTTGTAGVYELAPVPIPEPATVLTLASAALGLGALARRRLWRKATPEANRLLP